MATIQIIQGPDKQSTFTLVEGRNTVGRKGDPVRLTDGTVSREHMQLERRNGQWFIEDMGSANGTFVNGVRLTKPMALNRGDQVRCGATLLIFADSGDPTVRGVDVDEEGNLVDAAIVATIPSNEDSVVLPSAEAGAAAIDTLRILYDLINDLGSIFNTDLILRQTLEKVFTVLKADRGFVMLIDEKGRLSLKASRVSSDAGPQEVPISRTIIDEVVSNEVGVLSSNAMGDKRFTSGKSVHNFGIRSAICVPIKGRDRVLGVIHVDCSVSEHTYTTEQLRLLTAIGYQTGMAIDNVALHQAAVQSGRLAAVGETVAFLSHHIKNILQAFGAGADVVDAAIGRGDLDRVRESWPIVQRGLGRINKLILNMLAFSKEREPLLEPINVNHVLAECIESATAGADARGVAIMTDMDDVPPIPADADGLSQAFMNLVSNAMDAVADQTGVVTISSVYDSMNRVVIVRVIDNGGGIEEDKLGEIFTPFYSGKGQKGTGLGLAVAQKVVREHQGAITVASKPGQGATFTITLPARQGGAAGDTNMPLN